MMRSSLYVNATAVRLLGLRDEFNILYYLEVCTSENSELQRSPPFPFSTSCVQAALATISCGAALVAFYLLQTVRAFHINVTLMFSNLILVYLTSVAARFVIIAFQFEWLHQEGHTGTEEK